MVFTLILTYSQIFNGRLIRPRATTGYGFFLWDRVKYSIQDIVYNTIAIRNKDSINNPWYKYKQSDR